MLKKTSVKSFVRQPGSVFVDVPDPKGHSDFAQSWVGVSDHVKSLVPQPVRPSPTSAASEPRQRVTPHENASEGVVGHSRKNTPSIDTLFAESLPLFIEASRWGRYIAIGPASRIFDNTTFIYHNPCSNFWDLYELAKGIFRDLGIRVVKRGATWEAHIPIRVLTDKVFIDAGLAAVERTLMEHTGIDPVAILDEIRQRQYQETQDGIKRVKRNRMRSEFSQTVGDVVGVLAITAVSWVTYVVMGGAA